MADAAPRLRPVEVIPVQDQAAGGGRGVWLRDPADPEIKPISVSAGGVEVLRLLDGRRSVSDLVAALALRGVPIAEQQVRTFLEQLDQGGYLDSPRYAHRFNARKAAFLADPVRKAVHAGGAYAAAPGLPGMLRAGYLDKNGPKAEPAPRPADAAPIRALIAPHVDLHRGAPTYSWGYKALAEAEPAQLYVILGTCHTPVDGHFAATRKAYATPLGNVPADGPFLDELGKRYGRDLFEGEFSHANEHSIEFQAVYLRSLGLAGEDAAPIVPLLCDSLHSMVPPGKQPRDVARVRDFVDALGETLRTDGRRITLIAAVDFAHIGPRFGDDWPVDPAHQASVERGDREMVDRILAPDADGYYQQVMRDRDARRICGFTPLYILTALMEAEQRPGELLRYTQWVDTDLSSSVTFASAIFR
jgi:AmmeMemoRadiSam system protein B